MPSYGIFKHDIVFFNEPLSDDYHSTLSKDKLSTDLVIIMGTSLQVQPVASIPSEVPANVPIILINREVVGWPNEFDVNLLGNCDDICETLLSLLGWDTLTPKHGDKHIISGGRLEMANKSTFMRKMESHSNEGHHVHEIEVVTSWVFLFFSFFCLF